LSTLCNELNTDVANIEPGLKIAIDKFTIMIRSAGGDSATANGAYVKYVLHEGTAFEKTRLVRNLNAKLGVHNRLVIRIG
jgi:hypothetical protein